MVGERGPEVFVPDRPGTVFPALPLGPLGHANPDIYEGMDQEVLGPEHEMAYDPRGDWRINGDAFNQWLMGLSERPELIEDRRGYDPSREEAMKWRPPPEKRDDALSKRIDKEIEKALKAEKRGPR